MSFTYKYPHPAVTTDCVILTFHSGALKVLLIKRGIEPFKGEWALPGGFVKMDESAEEGALRELREETGVTGCTIKQFHTFSAPCRDPRERVISIAFYALMKWQQAVGADDADFADWLPVNSLPSLAFDHAEIIKLALEAVRRDIFFEPVGFDLLNEVFSMSELQKVYEAILGKEFDRRNFAKKMKHLKILDEVTEREKSEERSGEIVVHSSKIHNTLPFLYKDQVSPSLSTGNTSDSAKESIMVDLENNEEIHDMDDIKYEVEEEASDCTIEHYKVEGPYTFNCFSSNVFDFHPQTRADQPKKSKRRRNSWFRFNKNKYDKLKNDDMIEF